jgi:hypothetical protein
MDYLIGLLILFGPWAVGWLLGYRFGRTLWGLAAVIAAGVLVAGLWLLGAFLTADPWATADCRECSQYYGRAIDHTVVEDMPVYLAASWAGAAALAGTLARDRLKIAGVRGPGENGA